MPNGGGEPVFLHVRGDRKQQEIGTDPNYVAGRIISNVERHHSSKLSSNNRSGREA